MCSNLIVGAAPWVDVLVGLLHVFLSYNFLATSAIFKSCYVCGLCKMGSSLSCSVLVVMYFTNINPELQSAENI